MASKKTTNYEVIKKMSLAEMAAMLYIFAKPFTELLNMTTEQKEEIRKEIHEFLNTEVRKKREN